jgi:uncharacterized protein (TIGR03083 family)
MDFADYLTWTRADGERLAAVAELGLDAPVPSCPGWTVQDLVAHTGWVHRQKEQIVREGWKDGAPDPVDPPEHDLIAWYREGLDRMLDVFAAHDPSEHVATWYEEDQTVGFWYRRMACETVVHRIDAELAHGVVTDVDPALAGDAVDEILAVMMTGYPDWGDLTFGGETVRIDTADTNRSWTMRLAAFSGTSPNTGTTYEDESTFVFADIAQPRTVVTGEAEDVLLFLWGRRSDDGLAVVGDGSMLRQLRDVARDVTQ